MTAGSETLGLALSGGGLRATLFHLGIVRYLSEAGLLSKVSHITSVSGGSILAAHLVANWSRYVNPQTFDAAASAVIDFAQTDIRGRILRRVPTHFPLTYLHRDGLLRFPPRFQARGAIRTILLENYLDHYLYRGRALDEICRDEPDAPSLDILTTNLTRGTLAYFSSGGFAPDEATDPIPTRTRLSRAVAISAAFPAFFPPMPISSETLMTDKGHFPNTEYLTDGGVYDNLGVRRFQTILDQQGDRFAKVLVCDASGHFDWFVHHEAPSVLRTALRSTEILMQRMANLEREIAKLDEEPRFALLQISEMAQAVPHQVRHLIKAVRTDLDRFSDVECRTLQRHGHSIAASNRSIVGTTQKGTGVVPWTPSETTAAAKALRRSRLRKLGFISPRDGVSYVHFAATILLLLWPTRLLWGNYQEATFLAHLAAFQRDSFGLIREIDDPPGLLGLLERAEQAWPNDAAVQREIALASYSLISKAGRDEGLRERALLQFVRVVDHLEALPDLGERETRIFHQLRGHLHLEDGERLARNGHQEQSTISYRKALDSYQTYRRNHFKGLYGLEFNLCNVSERLGDYEYALERCDNADRFAREDQVQLWQAKFVTGHIRLKQGSVDAAASAFIDSFRIAVAGEEERTFKQYIQRSVHGWATMCEIPAFDREFRDLCG